MLHKAEAIQHLKSRISKLELERTQLQTDVCDTEQALRNVSKDREFMSIYIKNLLVSFDKARTTCAYTYATTLT